MAWRDTLNDLREELADVRLRRLERAEDDKAKLVQVHQEMADLSDSLGIGQLLSEMNTTLLEGRGEIETLVSWDQESDGGDSESDSESDSDDDIGFNEPGPDNDEDDEETITNLLSWDEDGDREIAVEVILDEEGISLQVNGVEIRPERDALEQALVEAFRDELEL